MFTVGRVATSILESEEHTHSVWILQLVWEKRDRDREYIHLSIPVYIKRERNNSDHNGQQRENKLTF